MTTPEPIADPHPHYARLRNGSAAQRVRGADEPDYWLVTRYAEARAALADRRLFADDPVPSAFQVERAEQVRPRIEEITAGLLDGFAGGDLIEHVALPLAEAVITELTGDPGQSRPVADVIGTGMVTLLRHPPQRAALRARPELLPAAVEELVRFDGPAVRSAPGRATVELTIGGTTIAEGDIVVVGLAAANRDPRRFPEPARLDLLRDPAGHLGFGHGLRPCPVAAPARVTAQVAIGALLRRFRQFSLAVPVDQLDWLPDESRRSLRSLPVTTG